VQQAQAALRDMHGAAPMADDEMMHRVVQQITALRLLVAEDLKQRIAVSANVDRVWHDHAPHSMPRVCYACYRATSTQHL
jgi:hypothetical protein